MTHNDTIRIGACCLFSLALAGCNSSRVSRLPTEPERRAMLSVMLPETIKIQPFTRIASFDDDDIPDGILMVVRTIDLFGDPIKAAGLFYFELWTYRPASGERKGDRLAYWSNTIDSAEKVRQHWTRSMMYEFQLGWTEGATNIRPGRKYVLTATYRSPWDETLQDEYEIEFTLPPGLLERKAAQSAPAGRR